MKSETRKEYDKMYRGLHKEEAAEYRKTHQEQKKVYDKKYRDTHKAQDAARSKAWADTHKDRVTDRHKKSRLKRKYNLSVEEYDRMLSDQGNKCAICGINQYENGELLCVDHDHNSGLVRGLLCKKCNSAIGLFMESLSIIKNAVSYLENK